MLLRYIKINSLCLVINVVNLNVYIMIFDFSFSPELPFKYATQEIKFKFFNHYVFLTSMLLNEI
jgi:hypothetical protein